MLGTHALEGIWKSFCECVCVCYANCYIYTPCLYMYVENKVPFIWCFQGVDFVEDALFKVLVTLNFTKLPIWHISGADIVECNMCTFVVTHNLHYSRHY